MMPTLPLALLSHLAVLSLLLPAPALAHGDQHLPPQVPADAPWALRHLAEEHHISNFDAGVFFSLHDFDSNAEWSETEIQRMYGLMDPSASSVPDSKREEVARRVLELFDGDQDGAVSMGEFLSGSAAGVQLPDFGLGPGHHGDDEYEYEIHHFERFHGEDATEEELTHPEDIEHFKKHDEEDARQEAWDRLESKGIVLQNIPKKFRRDL